MRFSLPFPIHGRNVIPGLMLLFPATYTGGQVRTLPNGPATIRKDNTSRVGTNDAVGVIATPEAPDPKRAVGESQRNPAAGHSTGAGLRDPFRSPTLARPVRIATPLDKSPRPPGAAGLAISQLQLRGLIEEKASQRMVAVVTGGQNLAYFLREGDRLYDGTVARITPTAVYLDRKRLPSDTKTNAGPVVLRLQPETGEKP